MDAAGVGLEILIPIAVGCLWGLTNPLIKRGVLAAARKPDRCYSGYRIVDAGIKSLTTPALIIPQVVNFLAGVVFAYSLRFCQISIAGPLANGVSLTATAIVALWLGERQGDVQRTAFGLAFVILGASLCARSK